MKSRTELLKEAENNSIRVGDHILKSSTAERYLGDRIHEDGTAASIADTLNNRIPLAK